MAIALLGKQLLKRDQILDDAVAFLSNDEHLKDEVKKYMALNGWEEKAVVELFKENCLVNEEKTATDPEE